MARQRIILLQPITINSAERWFDSYRTQLTAPYARRSIRRYCYTYHQPIVNRLIEEGRLDPRQVPAGKEFVKRMMVNYIRHELFDCYRIPVIAPGTDVETATNLLGTAERLTFAEVLGQATEAVGFFEAYRELNHRFLGLVRKKYPSLHDECDNQLSGAPLVYPEDIFRIYEISEE